MYGRRTRPDDCGVVFVFIRIYRSDVLSGDLVISTIHNERLLSCDCVYARACVKSPRRCTSYAYVHRKAKALSGGVPTS